MSPSSFPASVTQPDVQSDVPTNANEHCVGTESDQAGIADSCDGCPNQSICASLPKGPDPDLPLLQARLSTIKHKILVLSGKGGVGKSTFAAALSFALAADENVQVGAMDIDITGPSLPRIMGADGEQIHESSSGWTPIYVRDNLSLISTAFLLPTPDTPIIWRGPKKNGMIKQFIKDVDWDELDFLVIDTPPGTSDEHLSISTFLRQTGEASGKANGDVDGALLVTTPQEVALLDVRKELDFCRKAGIRVLGIVENMSGFVCPNCHGESEIFVATTGGAAALAKQFKVPFLGSVPLDPRIAKCCDFGESFVDEYPDSIATKAFLSVVKSTKCLIRTTLTVGIRQQLGYTDDATI